MTNPFARAFSSPALAVDGEPRKVEQPARFAIAKWLARRGVLLVAVIVVGIDLYAAVSHSATFARIGYANLSRPDRLVRDADLDPLSFYIPTGALVAAQQTIPPQATYAIAVGRGLPGADPKIIRDLLKLWLVPRLYTTKLSEAQWVIAYHTSSESLGVSYTKEIGLGPDVNVVEVTR